MQDIQRNPRIFGKPKDEFVNKIAFITGCDPLPIHRQSKMLTLAAATASQQGKYAQRMPGSLNLCGRNGLEMTANDTAK
ncbi:hypothetical protein [Specibacter sp. NPDC078692]|uniref:hypothetical protein n=1 Tax=Specibacter sp. NPDC078692 TaxID=3155818 RepID=UPI000CE3BCFE